MYGGGPGRGERGEVCHDTEVCLKMFYKSTAVGGNLDVF